MMTVMTTKINIETHSFCSSTGFIDIAFYTLDLQSVEVAAGTHRLANMLPATAPHFIYVNFALSHFKFTASNHMSVLVITLSHTPLIVSIYEASGLLLDICTMYLLLFFISFTCPVSRLALDYGCHCQSLIQMLHM